MSSSLFGSKLGCHPLDVRGEAAYEGHDETAYYFIQSIVIVKMCSEIILAFSRLGFLVFWLYFENNLNLDRFEVDMLSIGYVLTDNSFFVSIFFSTRQPIFLGILALVKFIF